jgi:serine/threonine protein kinase/TolB-like protein
MSEQRPNGIEGGTVIGEYEVVRILGRGATSTVWAARHRRLAEKEVAIKVLHRWTGTSEEAYASLRREATVLSQASQAQNIVYVEDISVLPDGTPYMILELLHGENLQQHLRRRRLPVELTLEIATQIARALDTAHRLGIVHRDLKPANVFLCPSGGIDAARYHVKVLDFGLARPQDTETVTTMSALAGTPQYMAPEQLLGTKCDARADLFAFGAIVYEMLSGYPPFAGGTLPEVVARVVHAAPTPLRQRAPHVSESMARAVHHALEKDPAHRPETVAAFLSELTGPPELQRRFRLLRLDLALRRPGWVGAVVAVLLLAAIAMLLVLRDGATPKVSELAPGLIQSRAQTDGRVSAVVVDFHKQGRNGGDNEWMGPALVASFNTELSKISQLKVVPPELFRHVILEARSDPMNAARQLGIRYLISGSYTLVGALIRIDTRVIDTQSGVQELAAEIEGPQDTFLSLQRQLALNLLGRIPVQLTKAEASALRAPASSAADKYRKLLATEGVAKPAPAEDGPHSHRHTLREPVAGLGELLRSLLMGLAQAQELAPHVELAVRETLESYRQAHQQGDIEGLAALYIAFPESQRQAVRDYTTHVEDLRIELANVHVVTRQHDVMVSYTRRDHFTDKETGEPVILEVQLTKFMVEDNGRWKFAAEN